MNQKCGLDRHIVLCQQKVPRMSNNTTEIPKHRSKEKNSSQLNTKYLSSFISDFEKLVDVCKKRPLEGSVLSVSKVHISNCVIILNLKPSTSSDTVQFYFENKRRSNGGEIEKVKMLEESGSCLVFFKDYTGTVYIKSK